MVTVENCHHLENAAAELGWYCCFSALVFGPCGRRFSRALRCLVARQFPGVRRDLYHCSATARSTCRANVRSIQLLISPTALESLMVPSFCHCLRVYTKTPFCTQLVPKTGLGIAELALAGVLWQPQRRSSVARLPRSDCMAHNIGAWIIRTGPGGQLYYNYNKEPPE